MNRQARCGFDFDTCARHNMLLQTYSVSKKPVQQNNGNNTHVYPLFSVNKLTDNSYTSIEKKKDLNMREGKNKQLRKCVCKSVYTSYRDVAVFRKKKRPSRTCSMGEKTLPYFFLNAPEES